MEPDSAYATGRSSESCPLRSTGIEPSDEDILQKPWKYIGYQGYANFIASEDDFAIYRRFNALNTRVALRLQDEIAALEEELNQLDQAYSRKEADDFHNGTIRNDMGDRMSVLESISDKLYRYNKFMLQQSSIKKYTKPKYRDVKSLRNWHFNHDLIAIADEERKYLDYEDDLISIAERDKSPLRKLIDSSYGLRKMRFWNQRSTQPPPYDDSTMAYYSDKRIDFFASAAIVLIGMAMLISPIWALSTLDDMKMKLSAISLYILLFLLVLSFAMVSKPFEVLGATAAYAAVLMVFIQIDTRW